MPRPFLNGGAAFLVWTIMTGLTCAQTKPRARDLGVPFDGVPGPLDAITDVKGVEVGHTTIISCQQELAFVIGAPEFIGIVAQG